MIQGASRSPRGPGNYAGIFSFPSSSHRFFSPNLIGELPRLPGGEGRRVGSPGLLTGQQRCRPSWIPVFFAPPGIVPMCFLSETRFPARIRRLMCRQPSPRHRPHRCCCHGGATGEMEGTVHQRASPTETHSERLLRHVPVFLVAI